MPRTRSASFAPFDQRRAAAHGLHHIVEVVRDAPGELAQGLHALAVRQLGLRGLARCHLLLDPRFQFLVEAAQVRLAFGQCRLGRLAGGDVLDDGQEIARRARGVAQQGGRQVDPQRRAVLADVALLQAVGRDVPG